MAAHFAPQCAVLPFSAGKKPEEGEPGSVSISEQVTTHVTVVRIRGKGCGTRSSPKERERAYPEGE